MPAPVQVWTPLPEHCLVPGVHEPEHIAPPSTSAQTELEQEAGAPHCPIESHVCTPLPEPASPFVEHCVVPGAQTPVHIPDAHA
jgi:hypothetical protein